MTRRVWLAGVLAAAGLTMTVAAAPQPVGVTKQTWQVSGVARTALVASPTAPVPAAGSPLVLVFHGHGGTSAHSARTYAIHTHWPEAVVIYAQGLPTPGKLSDPEGVKPGWQHTPGTEGDRDLKFTDEMIKWARARYRIDPARIFAAGHSNGGTFTYVLWAARADVFAAFAPSASVFRKELIASAKPKPALVILGEKDQLVPVAAQRLSLEATLRLDQASRSGEAWSGRYVTLHKSSIGATVVTYIHPGDHTMPDDAGQMMAKFFKQF